MTESAAEYGTRCGGSTSASSDALSATGAQVPAWFALRVRANREFSVERRLREAGIETFLPGYSEERRWSDRAKKIVRPLFPAYLFARLDPACELGLTLRLAGVIDVLPSRERAERIPEGEIDNVRRAAASAVAFSPCAYDVGETVTVESGPLAGVTGIVKRTKGATRIVIRIEILRRAVSVEVDAKDLGPKP
jgi:transcription termination/antitermination protein NusG